MCRTLIISGPRAHAIETAAVSAVAGSVLRPTDNESALKYCESMLIEDEVCEIGVSFIILFGGDTSSYQCFHLWHCSLHQLNMFAYFFLRFFIVFAADISFYVYSIYCTDNSARRMGNQ